MSTLIASILAIGGMGLIFGIGLSYAGMKFYVEEDPMIKELFSNLPGANCGGCGQAGCAAFAEALFNKKAMPTACPLASDENLAALSGILGVKLEKKIKKVAFIKCGGGREKSRFRYIYSGMPDCLAAMQLAAGGFRSCDAGCLGQKSCYNACRYNAIRHEDGIAIVDDDSCTGCGACIDACPKNLIDLIPQSNTIRIACNSHEKGKSIRANCSVGCITCNICVRGCKEGAITIVQDIAVIDYTKCTNCGDCVIKCPAKCILSTQGEQVATTPAEGS